MIIIQLKLLSDSNFGNTKVRVGVAHPKGVYDGGRVTVIIIEVILPLFERLAAQ